MSEISLERSIDTITEMVIEEAKLSENNKQKLEDLLYALVILRQCREIEKEQNKERSKK